MFRVEKFQDLITWAWLQKFSLFFDLKTVYCTNSQFMTLLKREIIDGKGERQRRKGSKNTHLSNVNQIMSVVVGMLSLLMTLNKFYSFSMSKYLVEVSHRGQDLWTLVLLSLTLNRHYLFCHSLSRFNKFSSLNFLVKFLAKSYVSALFVLNIYL